MGMRRSSLLDAGTHGAAAASKRFEPLVGEHLLVNRPVFVSRDRSADIPFSRLRSALSASLFMLIPYTGMRRDQGARAAGGARNGSR